MKKQKSVGRFWKSQTGFTLLEIMLVVVIIGLLAGTLIMNLSGVREDAYVRTARSMAKGTLSTAIEAYYLQNSAYPSSLDAMITKPSDAGSNWRPLLKEMPIDPWGQPYQYKCPGIHNPTSFDVYSMGPDKADGTADDIGNWATTTPSTQ